MMDKKNFLTMCVATFVLLLNCVNAQDINVNFGTFGPGSAQIDIGKNSIIMPNQNTQHLFLVNPSNAYVINADGNVSAIQQESIINAANLDKMSQESMDAFNIRDNENKIIIKKDNNFDNIRDLREKKKSKNTGVTIE